MRETQHSAASPNDLRHDARADHGDVALRDGKRERESRHRATGAERHDDVLGLRQFLRVDLIDEFESGVHMSEHAERRGAFATGGDPRGAAQARSRSAHARTR